MSWNLHETYPTVSTSRDRESTLRQATISNVRSGISSLGGEGDSTPKFLSRGIYLRPTVFMINGTATHLLESLKFNNTITPGNIAYSSFFSSSSTGSTTMTLTQPLWWGYMQSDLPTCWVSFNYELQMTHTGCSFLHTETYTALPTQESIEDELVQDSPLELQGNTADVLHLQAIRRQISISLRENRLAAPFRGEYYAAVGEPIESGQISTFLGGAGEYLAFSSVLIGGVEVALRAMQPGQTFGFLIANRDTRYESIDNAYELRSSAHSISPCFYIKIELLRCVRREPILPPIFQKYVVRPSSSTRDSMETTSNTQDVAYAHTRFFRFFSSALFRESVNPAYPHSLIYSHALPALFTAVISAAGFRHAPTPLSSTQLREGYPGGIPGHSRGAFVHSFRGTCTDAGGIRSGSKESSGSSTDNSFSLTDDDARMFVYLHFLALPSDGATITCKVVRNGELTGIHLLPEEMKEVHLGGMAMPLWLDMLLRTMRRDEEDVVNLYMNGESDVEFHCTFVEGLRNIVMQHVDGMRSAQACSSARCEEDDSHHHHRGQQEHQQHQLQPRRISGTLTHESFNTFDNVNVPFTERPRVGGERNLLLAHSFSCHVVLEEFKNAYDMNAFFFVNPAASLQAVQQLESEVRDLCRVGRDVYANGYSGKDDVVNSCNLPPCVTEEMIRVQPVLLGHSSHCIVGRSIVKAIHKLNFIVLLLTFHVDEENMVGKCMVTPLIFQERRIALGRTFLLLGKLYSRLRQKRLYVFAFEAYSAAISIRADDEQPWLHRGKLLREYHRASALHDFQVARSLLQMKLQQYFTQHPFPVVSEGETDGVGRLVSTTHGSMNTTGDFHADRAVPHLQKLWHDVTRYIEELQQIAGTPQPSVEVWKETEIESESDSI